MGSNAHCLQMNWQNTRGKKCCMQLASLFELDNISPKIKISKTENGSILNNLLATKDG